MARYVIHLGNNVYLKADGRYTRKVTEAALFHDHPSARLALKRHTTTARGAGNAQSTNQPKICPIR